MERWIILLLPLLFFNVPTATAQVKIANNWYFGDGTNLDFSFGSPVLGQTSGAYTYEGCASYSDPNGNLLFYTNGGSLPPLFSGGIWNSNHLLMDNGNLDSANGCLSSHGGTFAFPDPTLPGIYHMFTLDCLEMQYAGGLRYNKIDMNENVGLGKVVVKDSLVYRQTINLENVHGIFNSEGNSYWIFMFFRNISGIMGPDTIVRLEVTSGGINGPFKQTITCPTCGIQAAAPNGRQYLFGENLFDINPATGQLSNQVVYPSAIGGSSVSFSPNSNLIYASQNLGSGSHLYQYRLDTTDIPASELALESLGGVGDIYSMQMGPDGKLYLLTTMGIVGVVECPNKRGSACNVNMNFMTLPATSGSLPQALEFPNYPSHFFASNDTCGVVITGQTEVNGKPVFIAVPNPASEMVRVKLEKNGKEVDWIRLRLLAMDGYEVLRIDKAARSFPVDIYLQEVPPGIYLIEAQWGDEYFHQRLVVE